MTKLPSPATRADTQQFTSARLWALIEARDTAKVTWEAWFAERTRLMHRFGSLAYTEAVTQEEAAYRAKQAIEAEVELFAHNVGSLMYDGAQYRRDGDLDLAHLFAPVPPAELPHSVRTLESAAKVA